MLTFCKINLVRNIHCNQTTLTQHLNQGCNYSRIKIHLWNDLEIFPRKLDLQETSGKNGNRNSGLRKKDFSGMEQEFFFFLLLTFL